MIVGFWQRMPNYDAAVCVKVNSIYRTKEDEITSLKIYDGRGSVCNTTFREIISVDEQSAVYGDGVCLHHVKKPNVRVKGGSVFQIGELKYTEGKASDLVLEADETSRMAYQDRTQGTAGENAVQAADGEQRSNAREQLEHLIGEVLYESGAFKSDEFKLIEASEPDFISQNVGGTAQQTLALLEKAKGGVLFIDEAYALNKKGANVDFGIEAINTILKYMEDHRGEIMIIFAGYTKEMEQFLKTNPGLTSRVPNKFVFEDYTPDEIVEIGEKELNKKQYKCENREYYVQ